MIERQPYNVKRERALRLWTFSIRIKVSSRAKWKIIPIIHCSSIHTSQYRHSSYIRDFWYLDLSLCSCRSSGLCLDDSVYVCVCVWTPWCVITRLQAGKPSATQELHPSKQSSSGGQTKHSNPFTDHTPNEWMNVCEWSRWGQVPPGV